MNPPPSTKGRRVAKINRLTQALLIKHLLEGIYTIHELADLTGLHPVTVTDYTRELHRAGAAHIAGWEKDGMGRDAMKIYKIGKGKDKPRQVMTRAEIVRRHRAKKAAVELIQRTAGAMA